MDLADLVLAYCRIVDAHQFNKQAQIQQYEAYAAMRTAAQKSLDRGWAEGTSDTSTDAEMLKRFTDGIERMSREGDTSTRTTD